MAEEKDLYSFAWLLMAIHFVGNGKDEEVPKP